MVHLHYCRCLRLVLGNLAAWTHGSSIVYPSAIFDPPAIVDAVVQEKCTALHGVPTHFIGVLQEIEKRQAAGEHLDLSRLRRVCGVLVTNIMLIDSLDIQNRDRCGLTNPYAADAEACDTAQSERADHRVRDE